MHRLLLRPITRACALRVPSSSRTLPRAFTTSTCTKFSATTPKNKRSNKKSLSEVDDDIFGSLDGAARRGEVGREVPQQELAHTRARSAPEDAEREGAEEIREFEATEEASLETQIPAMGVPIPSESHIDLEEYLASWFSHETNEILAAMGISRYSFIAAAVEHPFVANFARSLTGQERKEFEDHWIAFETSDKQDDTGLIPVVEFFLRHGIQIIPPTLSCPFPDDCIRTVEPSIVEETFKGETGVWHQKGQHIEKHRAEPILYPDLRQHDAMLDPRDVIEIPPDEMSPHHNRVIIRNHRSVFHNYESDADDLLDEEVPGSGSAEQDSNDSILKSIPVPGKYYQNLYHSILMRRSVVQQTGKGKIRRIAYMVLVGDGNGLVGYGEGKHSNSGVAMKAARIAAIKNMDWVERFEKRTIWTEMQAKLGATQVILRPRPVGFGLRCNPFVHQILRAAGMKDISAKVWGSRNKLNVIKALFRMLHAGHAPTGMGDGVGGPGKKLSKGVGVRGKGELERARGRKLINLRK